MTTEQQSRKPRFQTLSRIACRNDLFRDPTIHPILQTQYEGNPTSPYGPTIISIQLGLKRGQAEKWLDALHTKFINLANRYQWKEELYVDLNSANLTPDMTMQHLASVFKCYTKMNPMLSAKELLLKIKNEAELLPEG